MKPKEVTILLVEDDDIDAMAVQRGFDKHKIANQIVRAKDGLEALELIRSEGIERPYLVLLDLNMPRMNGFEFLEQVRVDDELKKTTIFVLTSSKEEEDVLKAYDLHVAGYFVKSEVGAEFNEIIHLLGGYWKVAHLPEKFDNSMGDA